MFFNYIVSLRAPRRRANKGKLMNFRRNLILFGPAKIRV